MSTHAQGHPGQPPSRPPQPASPRLPRWLLDVLRDENFVTDVFRFVHPYMSRESLFECLTADPSYFHVLVQKIDAARAELRARVPDDQGYHPDRPPVNRGTHSSIYTDITDLKDDTAADDDNYRSYARPPPPVRPTFKGEEFESFEDFLDDLEQYCQSIGCHKKTHPQRKYILRECLENYPKIMLRKMSQERQADFLYVIHQLDKVYGRANKDKSQLLEQIQKCKFTDFKTLSSYATEKIKMLEYAGLDDKDQVTYFVNGLPDTVRPHMAIARPQNVHVAWEVCRTLIRSSDTLLNQQPQQITAVDSRPEGSYNNNNNNNKRVTFRNNSPYPTYDRRDRRDRSDSRGRGTSYDNRGRSPERRQDNHRGRSYDNRGRSPERRQDDYRRNNDYRRSSSRDDRSPHSYRRRDSRSRSQTSQERPRSRSNSYGSKDNTPKQYCKMCNDYHTQGRHIIPQCFRCHNYGHLKHECKAPALN